MANPHRMEGWDQLLVAVAEQARADLRTAMTHEHTPRGSLRATRHHHPGGEVPHDHALPGRYRAPAAPDRCSTGEDHPYPPPPGHHIVRFGSRRTGIRSKCKGCSWETAPLMDPAWNGETHTVVECAQELLDYLEEQFRAGADPMDALFKVVVS